MKRQGTYTVRGKPGDLRVALPRGLDDSEFAPEKADEVEVYLVEDGPRGPHLRIYPEDL